MRIYKQALKLQTKLGTLSTWSVAINKTKWNTKFPQKEILHNAWRFMIQRIERFTNYGEDTAMIFPDEGEEKYVRGLLKRNAKI